MNGRAAPRPRCPAPPLAALWRDVTIALLIIASRLEDTLTNRSDRNIQTGFLSDLSANSRCIDENALCAPAHRTLTLARCS